MRSLSPAFWSEIYITTLCLMTAQYLELSKAEMKRKLSLTWILLRKSCDLWPVLAEGVWDVVSAALFREPSHPSRLTALETRAISAVRIWVLLATSQSRGTEQTPRALHFITWTETPACISQGNSTCGAGFVPSPCLPQGGIPESRCNL